jgi:hypothetical protein
MEVDQRPSYTAPLSAIETTLANIWSEVLYVHEVGRDDSFHELGGNLYSAVSAAEKIRQTLGVALPAAFLLSNRTVSDVAKEVRARRRRALAPISPVPRSSPLPLSFAQQRLWILSQIDGGSAAYNVPLGLRLRGPLDEEALGRALDRLMERHEALRTRIETVDGVACPRVSHAHSGFIFRRHDLIDQDDAEDRLQAIMTEEAHAPFDLERGPLARARLVRVAPQDHALLITLHHIVSDGWSVGTVLRRELGELYRAFVRGQPDPLVPLAIQYADYAAWQRRWLSAEALTEQSAYWLARLAGAPPLLDLPTDRKRPMQQTFAGNTIAIELDEKLTAGLKLLGQRYGMTLFMILLTAWALVLSRLSGQEDVVIGTPITSRTRTDLDGLIGLFVNSIALRLDLSGDLTVQQMLDRARVATLEAQENQDLPYEQVVELVRPVRSLANTPIFQVMFSWENDDTGSFELVGLTTSEIPVAAAAARFDLTLTLKDSGRRIVGGLNYATALFDAATAERHMEYLRRVLEQTVKDPNQEVAAVDLLSDQERQQMLTEWNSAMD